MYWIAEELDARQHAVLAAIASMPAAAVLDVETDRILPLLDRSRVTPVVLRLDEMTRTEPEELTARGVGTTTEDGQLVAIDLGVDHVGFGIDFLVPFTGDGVLLAGRPDRHFLTAAASSSVEGSVLRVRYEERELDTSKIETWLLKMQRQLLAHQAWANQQAATWWDALEPTARRALDRRRGRLEAAAAAADALSVPLPQPIAATSSRAVKPAAVTDPLDALRTALEAIGQPWDDDDTEQQLRERLDAHGEA
ncbi:hypothetical protein DEJ28_14190 [Curtobacterium sp. MCPF17_002]|uniref:hypothetical protein n=1 Tax=Curtobacterium sp. MCPF17_002 TaxID=2175645 RepID=UPI000DA6DDAE|nr:hypothetical protein [Curtobacterium sp. MCPF17_002]WIB76792.1 hypothetical protein DEJ28_14190 [Curtobacterium sp. MCPF17_002]